MKTTAHGNPSNIFLPRRKSGTLLEPHVFLQCREEALRRGHGLSLADLDVPLKKLLPSCREAVGFLTLKEEKKLYFSEMRVTFISMLF